MSRSANKGGRGEVRDTEGGGRSRWEEVEDETNEVCSLLSIGIVVKPIAV